MWVPDIAESESGPSEIIEIRLRSDIISFPHLLQDSPV